ncbi:MAG: hypothetical protein K6C34_01900 [Alphaproteobacteria bacterium]|nr:hypothetical protein [Alphaproteobacteria bacterium]
MKKIVLASALLVAPFAFAEETAVDTATDNNVAIEQQHAAYEGFYLGLGVEAAELGHKVEYTWPTGETDVDANHSQTRLGGALVFGFGKKIPGKNFYAGIEAGINFGPTTTELSADNYAQGVDNSGNAFVYLYDLEVKHNSFVPQLALRFGYVDCETKMMTYIKLGAAYSRVKGIYNDWTQSATGAMTSRASSEFKCNGVTPIVALGVEKAFAKKMTGRLEAEYRFGHSKSTSGESTYVSGGAPQPAAADSSKLIQKGTITLRAMFCYNIKI